MAGKRIVSVLGLCSLSGRKRTREDFTELKNVAIERDALICGIYKDLKIEDLTSGIRGIVLPSLLGDTVPFHYMGRHLTKKIVEFIQEDNSAGRIRRLVKQALLIITGTPGAGKTYSVAAASGYMHTEFSSAQKSLNSGSRQLKAVAYVDRDDLVKDPFSTLWGALVLAFIHDTVTLESLRSLNTTADIVAFVRNRRSRHGHRSFHLIVDDGNRLDASQTSDEEDKKLRRIARDLLFSLSELCIVVLCSSIRSQLRKALMKDTRPRHFLVCGGYTDAELQAYLKFAREVATASGHELESDVEKLKSLTGSVPRLVYDYMYGGIHELQSSLKWYKDGIRGFIEKASVTELSELEMAARGEVMEPLTAALDSRAFYISSNGRARCLTGELLSHTISILTSRVQKSDAVTNLGTVTRWARIVSGDTNGPRIGWNAEAAGILALRLLEPQICADGAVLIKVRPQVTNTFEGTFTRKTMGDSKVPTVHIPLRFNHIGADVYYTDDEWVVVFQFSAATNAKDHHPNTMKVANELFKDDPRKKAVVWVVYSPRGLEVQKKLLRGGIVDITMSFTQLSLALDQIDETLWSLKGDKKPHCPSYTCPECFKDVSTDSCVDCTLCGNAMHFECAGNPQTCMCKFCRAVEEDNQDEGTEVPKCHRGVDSMSGPDRPAGIVENPGGRFPEG